MINNNFLNSFGRGGGVKRLLFHTAPLQQKHNVKICFSPLHEALHNFLFFKKSVLGNNPGMHSMMTSRNGLLGGLLEHAPGQASGTTQILSLNLRYLNIGINANVNLSSIL